MQREPRRSSSERHDGSSLNRWHGQFSPALAASPPRAMATLLDSRHRRQHRGVQPRSTMVPRFAPLPVKNPGELVLFRDIEGQGGRHSRAGVKNGRSLIVQVMQCQHVLLLFDEPDALSRADDRGALRRVRLCADLPGQRRDWRRRRDHPTGSAGVGRRSPWTWVFGHCRLWDWFSSPSDLRPRPKSAAYLRLNKTRKSTGLPAVCHPATDLARTHPRQQRWR